jgi:DNA-binding SARP family transcriptional activator/Tfp pilus assembly protein PilF
MENGSGPGTLVISVLGSPSIQVDGAPVEVDTRKAIALLVYLAVTGRTQSRERLSGLLWPDYEDERARAALRRTLSTLKKALGDRWVSADRLGVSLDVEAIEVDLASLRAAVKATDDHDHSSGALCAGCMASLSDAIDGSQGRFLHGFSLRDAEPFEEWMSLEAESVEREIAAILDKLVQGATSAGDLEAASDFAQRKLALDPLDEPARRRLMQIYAWRGMRAAALQQYRECVAVLDRELGVSPLAETTALYSAISEGAVETKDVAELERPSQPVPATAVDAFALKGRAEEWELLSSAYGRVTSAVGSFLVVEGEAGIGKTRLVSDFLAKARGSGAATATARAHEGERGVPYGLFAQLLQRLEDRDLVGVDRRSLAEASRLVPGLNRDETPLGSIDDPGGTTRFFEGLRVVLRAGLSGEPPGIVFLDDLHWCDEASLDALAYVLRRLDRTPALFVLSWRTEEVAMAHPLRRLTSEIRTGESVVLGRLQDEHVRALVAEARDRSPDDVDQITTRLMQETEGIPFFVIEYLKSLEGMEGSAWQMPSSVKELLRSRANLVDQAARQVLGTAAVIDRSFDFETVWRASGRTELETVDALDDLVAHGLLISLETSTPEAVYEFSHENLRGFIYESLSPARRRVLHRRAGEALASTARRLDRLGSVSALVARHLELGGAEDEAVGFHEIAARHARSVYANREALGHYLSALALQPPEPEVMHEGAGDMHVLLGEYDRAVAAYQKAAALVTTESISRLEHKLGEVHLRRGDWELAQSHFAAALETLDPAESAGRARLLTAMSFAEHRKGNLEVAMDLAERALKAAADSEDDGALAEARNQAGLLENARGRHDAAVVLLNQSLGSATERGDATGRVAALNNLAWAARSQGRFDEALDLTTEALDICAEVGDSHREAALRNNAADLYHQKGDNDAAMENLKRATKVLAQIGAGPEGLLPEVWKLVEW